MASFELAGQRVTVTIDLERADACKEIAGLDPLDIKDARIFSLLEDVRLAASVVHCCSDWSGGIEAFGRAWRGEVIEAGVTAFWEALADFSPPHLRPSLEQAAASARTINKQAAAMVGRHLEKVTPAALERLEAAGSELMDKMLAELSALSVGDLLEKPDLTPDASASAG